MPPGRRRAARAGRAAAQVLRAGDPEQHARAGKVLADAKRSLYLILADSEPEAE